MHITYHEKNIGFTHITIMVCEYTSVNAADLSMWSIINIYIIFCSFNVNLGDIMNGLQHCLHYA